MAKERKTNTDENASITILIHGTFSQRTGRWHRPGSRFHRFLRQNYFPDVYCGADFFEWSGGPSDDARLCAAKKLVDWCKKHPATQFNLISHSHGTNVANLATHHGLENVNKLIHLSPPVWGDKAGYLPKMEFMQDKAIYNIRSQVDLIVTKVANAAQNYDRTRVDEFEKEYVLPGAGHWQPVRVRNWKRYDIGDVVTRNDMIA